MVKSSITETERARTAKNLRILMLVGYSSGPSGVWQRCKDEAIEFAEKMMSEKGTPHFVTTYRGLDLLFKQISQSQG